MDWLSHEHLSDRQAETEWRGLTLLSTVRSDMYSSDFETSMGINVMQSESV